VNSACTRLLLRLRREPALLEGCVSALIVDGGSELYTKSAAAELAFALNCAGSALIGRPLAEGTASLRNYRVQAKIAGTDLAGAYRAAVRETAERLAEETFPKKEKPELLVLHASSYGVSNTMELWTQVKRRLGDAVAVTEIGLRNGAVSDCSGCPYTACLHFGETGRCFYGGVMQDEVWPAVLRCDAVMLLCPNYNDALSANLTAFVNRLTGLFRQTRFYDKAVFAIVVSGYSGGDVVARQVISAMNMNKSFYLPPRFALIETANDPGEALRLDGIETRLDAFASRIQNALVL
ncbi:MAG: flavodoxin family protein, partial [Oscillibacter sp.]|nr:flavodoxin family protein [Oscillibacter sp.]